MAMQSLEVDIRQDIFIGTAAKPEIADVVRGVDLIRLYVCSDGDDKGTVLNLERKFYAEFFSDHFMTGGVSPGISTKLDILLHQSIGDHIKKSRRPVAGGFLITFQYGRLLANYVFRHDTRHLPIGGMARGKLQFLVGVLQSNKVASLPISRGPIQVGDPIGLVLGLYG
jgi:hypothetical protein